MSNLAQKLCDADVIVYDNVSYEVTSHDNQQMKAGSKETCIYTKEEEYGAETNFTFDELNEAEEDQTLQVYTLQLWDNIQPSAKDLERVCEENFPGSEILTRMEAVERWSVLNKYELKALDDCLKLRVLAQREDARDIITRATKAEHLNAKRASTAIALMHAVQCGRNMVFYEWTDPTGSVCKGGRYGTQPHEYCSFHL